ncbi:MAG: hypothetical protein AAFP86_21180, partial [Planctomycetota bacterium]
IGTSSTFRDLLQNFQLNVSQGLQAGLNLDEFREIAKLFSQGATLFGVPQNQLAEEIRSVLQGTIRARDTRIAVALGITNEEIRQARNAGRLAEFLRQEFVGVAAASEGIRGTLPVAFSDVLDSTQLLLERGVRPLSDELRGLVIDVRDSIGNIDEGFDSDTLQGASRVFEPLRQALQAVRENARPLFEVFESLTFSVFAVVGAAAELVTALSPVLSVLG